MTNGRDTAVSRDADHFDERADRFRDVQEDLDERACVSPNVGRSATGYGSNTLTTPAAYGTIDDLDVVETSELPEWYRDRATRGRTLSQRTDGCILEASPKDGPVDDPGRLFLVDEYLRLDVLVDGELWDTYIPIPRSSDEYGSSAFAILRDRLDGRPIERFHCARMPIRYEDGRYVPDYGNRTFDRWLREQRFVYWIEDGGYELKPGLRVPELFAWVVAIAAGGFVAGSVTLAFVLLSIPELFVVGIWFLLPMTYLASVEIARRGFRSVFKRLGPIWKRRVMVGVDR